MDRDHVARGRRATWARLCGRRWRPGLVSGERPPSRPGSPPEATPASVTQPGRRALRRACGFLACSRQRSREEDHGSARFGAQSVLGRETLAFGAGGGGCLEEPGKPASPSRELSQPFSARGHHRASLDAVKHPVGFPQHRRCVSVRAFLLICYCNRGGRRRDANSSCGSARALCLRSSP